MEYDKLSPFRSNAASYSRDSVIVIEPIPGSNPGSGGPRLPAQIPISAYYDSFSCAVFLSFNNDIGEITVELLNSNFLGYTFLIIDTNILSAIIPVNTSGHFIITFTLSSGLQYQGEFDVT